MKILVTRAASLLGRNVAKELATDHELRLCDAVEVDSQDADLIRGDLRDPHFAWQMVRGVDAIIHTGEPPPDLPVESCARDEQLLDHATRGTHVLLSAAVEAGIQRILYGSTLEIFSTYDDDVYISEMWKPLPPPDMSVMSRYLGELTCREFARDFPVGITALRLGRLVLEEEVTNDAPDLMWLDRRDAARAFAVALARNTASRLDWSQRWAIFHICAAIPNGKFLLKAARGLSFSPKHNFPRHWPAKD